MFCDILNHLQACEHSTKVNS